MGKTLLLLVQVILLAVFVKAQWPCPEAADIAPCVCSFVEDLYLDLNCSNIANDAELVNAFKAPFPFQKFREFRIEGTVDNLVPIQNLSANVFGDIYFQFIYIRYTTLSIIEGDPFAKSQNLLERVEMMNNKLLLYPFDTLESYTQLAYLRLDRNNLLHMADINSPTLTYLNVNYNPDLKYGDQAFHSATNLRNLNLRNITLTNIAPNTFRPLPKLTVLDLSFNNIHILWNGSLWFSSTILRRVTINNNILDTIEVGAIDFCDPSGTELSVCDSYTGAKTPNITMQDNLLTDLPKDVWEESFMLPTVTEYNAAAFEFQGNPIQCGCNIAWVVLNTDYLLRVHPDSGCSNGDTFADLDPAFFGEMCKAPSTVPPSVKHY